MPKKKAKKPAVKAKKTVSKSKKSAPKPVKKSGKTAKPAAKKTVKAAPKPKQEVVAGLLLGEVEDYYTHVGVATVTLKDAVRLGDTIRIKGHTTDLIQKVESMQIDHVAVTAAKAKDPVGIKVGDRCRKGDKIYKI